MQMKPIARSLASQGRYGDSMLVHMTPREVAGLQALARNHGTTMTVNPQTGLPEAFNLGNLLPTILGIGGTFLGIPPHITAMAVGGLETARTGDLGSGIMAGLGAYGGGSMAGALGAGAPASTIGELGSGLNAPGLDSAATAGLDSAAQYSISPSASQTSLGLSENALSAGSEGLGSTFSGSPSMTGITPSANALAPAPQTSFMDKFAQAAAGPGGTPSTLQTTLAGTGVVAPVLFAPPPPMNVANPEESSNYEGPYSPTTRELRYPDRDPNDTSEFEFFTPSNPIPFAEGGEARGPIKMPGADYQAGVDPEFNYGFKPIEVVGGFGPSKGSSAGGIGGAFNRILLKAFGKSFRVPDLSTYEYDPMTQQLKLRGMASGGIAAYKKGTFLQGRGDGMSDSIPATIEGKQPARLADGEFVVPADVVSHLGNGSSKAGAERLYEMMDRIRQERTGKKKQAPKISANKYMPA